MGKSVPCISALGFRSGGLVAIGCFVICNPISHPSRTALPESPTQCCANETIVLICILRYVHNANTQGQFGKLMSRNADHDEIPAAKDYFKAHGC